MDTFATRHSYKIGRRSKSPRKKSPPQYKPYMVYANEYDDSPTERMIEQSRKKPIHPEQVKLDKLEKRLMVLEHMDDDSERVADLKQEINRIKRLIHSQSKKGGKSRRKRTYKKRS